MKSFKFGVIAALCLFMTQVTAGESIPDYTEATNEVKALLENSEIYDSFNYCTPGTLTCRRLVILADKTTGRVLPSFIDQFLSGERAVGATAYFLLNENGTYRFYSDGTFDGQVNIDRIDPLNQGITVDFDSYYFPTIRNLRALRLGTTREAIVDIIFTPTEARAVGEETDSADPDYRQYINIIYDRQ